MPCIFTVCIYLYPHYQVSRSTRIDSEYIESKIPEFRKIIGFRNILAHGYDIVDEASLWDFAQNRVPELLTKVNNY
ncbi:MAG: HepT-like ribonuclease domain-containing protein [Planctomycetota bacterium]